jgi:membrane protease YdiL (CAAX protease family)
VEEWPLQWVPPQRPVGWPLLLMTIGVESAVVILAQLVVFRDAEKWVPWGVQLYRETGGLVNFTLLTSIFSQAAVIGVVLMGVGRLRPASLGLDLRRVPAAIVWTFLAWAAAQVVTLVAGSVAGETVRLHDHWSSGFWTRPTGDWMSQLLGNALFEEVFFRGFVLPQCVWSAMTWLRGASDRTRVGAALVASQAIFALGHVPFNLVNGSGTGVGQWMLLAQFAMGLILCGVYLRTGNLFLAVGLHAATNNPGPLLTGGPVTDNLPRTLLGIGMLVAVTIFPRVSLWIGGLHAGCSRCKRPSADDVRAGRGRR